MLLVSVGMGMLVFFFVAVGMLSVAVGVGGVCCSVAQAGVHAPM